MKNLPLRIIGTLTLAIFALSPGQGLGAESGPHTLGNTSLVSVASDGAQGNSSSAYPSISGNGRYQAFKSYATNLVDGDTNNRADILVHDRQTGSTVRISVASDGTQANLGVDYDASMTRDGCYVVFESWSDNLVSGDTNNTTDVFIYKRPGINYFRFLPDVQIRK